MNKNKKGEVKHQEEKWLEARVQSSPFHISSVKIKTSKGVMLTTSSET